MMFPTAIVRRATVPLAVSALMLAGCGGPDAPVEDNVIAEDEAASGAAPAKADDAAPVADSAAPATDGAAADGAAAGGALTAYVGKWPFDEVNGVKFGDDPRVKAAIEGALRDPALVRAVTTTEGPGTAIFSSGGRIAAWGCQQHNCGDHQWTVFIDPATGAGEVCYRNAEQGAGSRWYRGGQARMREGDCPSE